MCRSSIRWGYEPTDMTPVCIWSMNLVAALSGFSRGNWGHLDS